MLQRILYNEKFWQSAAITLILFCVGLFAYTNKLIYLGVPFVLLFVALLFVNWKTAWWILLFSIPCSIQIWFFNDRLGTSVPDEPIMGMFLILGIVLIAWSPKVLPKWWWRNPLVLIVALQYIWTFITVLFSHELLFSVKFFLAKSWFLMAYFIVPIWIFKTKSDFKKGFLLLIVPTLITALIIFLRHGIQYQFMFRRVELAIGELYYNHVDYSTFISMIFPLVVVAYPLTRKLSVIWRWLILAAIIFLLPAIYLTYARAAVLAVIFSLVVMVAIRQKWVKILMPACYGFVALIIIYMSTGDHLMEFRPNFQKTYMRDNFIDHVKATIKGKDMSSVERIYRWIGGVRMSKDEPLYGFGPNSFYYHYKPYTISTFRTWVSRNEEKSTSHNYFLYMLTEQGWPAMILYAILLMVYFAHAQKVYHRWKDRFYKSATMGLAMMFAAGFVNNFFSELNETHKVGALFYLSMSLLVVLDYMSRQEEKALKKASIDETNTDS